MPDTVEIPGFQDNDEAFADDAPEDLVYVLDGIDFRLKVRARMQALWFALKDTDWLDGDPDDLLDDPEANAAAKRITDWLDEDEDIEVTKDQAHNRTRKAIEDLPDVLRWIVAAAVLEVFADETTGG